MKKKKLSFLFILLFLLSNILYSNHLRYQEQIKITGEQTGLFDEIYEKYGVRVVTNVNSLIPQHWKDYPVSGKSSPLSSDLYKKAATYIKIALSEYPREFLTKNLKAIGICDSLSFYDVPYGGTAVYDNNSIIITVKKWTEQEWFVGTIHHELNHLLVYWNNFPKDVWSMANKPGFKYGNGGKEAIQNGKASLDRTESDFREGFVCQYGQSAIEEDIATFVEYVLTDRSDFLSRALKYPIIKRKFDILTSFYYKLDKRFDEKFWTGNKKIESNTTEREYSQNNNEKKSEKYSQDSSSSLINTLQFYRNEDPDTKGFNFNSKDVSYLSYYLILNNFDQESKTISVTVYYYYPDGSEMGNFTKNYSCKYGDNAIYCSWGFGWREKGYWKKGKYKAIFYIDGDYLTEVYFTLN